MAGAVRLQAMNACEESRRAMNAYDRWTAVVQPPSAQRETARVRIMRRTTDTSTGRHIKRWEACKFSRSSSAGGRGASPLHKLAGERRHRAPTRLFTERAAAFTTPGAQIDTSQRHPQAVPAAPRGLGAYSRPRCAVAWDAGACSSARSLRWAASILACNVKIVRCQATVLPQC